VVDEKAKTVHVDSSYIDSNEINDVGGQPYKEFHNCNFDEFIADKKTPKLAKDIYLDNDWNLRNDNEALALLDSLTAKNNQSRPFYFKVVTKTYLKSDGYFSEGLGLAGKEYVENSQLLEQYTIPINPGAVASAGSIPTLAAVSISGAILSGNESLPSSSSPIRYFYKDLTSSSNLIKQIDKKAYDQLSDKLSNTYQVISYNKNTQTLEEVNKQMPGLAAFLGT
jgi:hypothetical protein